MSTANPHPEPERTIAVVGIGAGSPGHITFDAAAALQQADVVLALDKGEVKADLMNLRREILSAHAPEVPVVTVTDPPRDRNPQDYAAEVRRWHQARAELLNSAIIENSAPGGTVAFLVWGDPSLYDSSLRIIARMQEYCGLAARVVVYPGITAVQALTAAHGIVLNRIGEDIAIITGRRLGEVPREIRNNCVVMLDGGAAWQQLDPAEQENTYMWWGAYLGTPKQVLRHGLLAEIAEEVAQQKAALRAEHGWIMDTYLLRAHAAENLPAI